VRRSCPAWHQADPRLLAALPWKPKANCEPGHYYMVHNINPGFLPNGVQRTTATFVPRPRGARSAMRLSEKGLTWAYFGGAYNAAVNLANGSVNPADAIGAAYCQICNRSSTPSPSWATRCSASST